MEKKNDKTFTWVIKNLSSLKNDKIYSDKFVVGGCKWYLSVFPKGNKIDHSLSLYLEVPDYESLPLGWRRHARYFLTIVNQNSEKSSKRELVHWFDEKSTSWGYPSMITLNELYAKDSGFLVNGDLKINVEIDLLEVIGKVDVHGFQLIHSQVENVNRMFEKHPEIASEFRPKTPNLKTGYMNLLLSLIETLCQPTHDLTNDDLDEAYVALESLTGAGFKLDWLKEKLDQVSIKKEKANAREIRMQVIEKQLKKLKQKWSDLESQLEKEKADALASKAPILFDDFI